MSRLPELVDTGFRFEIVYGMLGPVSVEFPTSLRINSQIAVGSKCVVAVGLAKLRKV